MGERNSACSYIFLYEKGTRDSTAYFLSRPKFHHVKSKVALCSKTVSTLCIFLWACKRPNNFVDFPAPFPLLLLPLPEASVCNVFAQVYKLRHFLEPRFFGCTHNSIVFVKHFV